ncbi:E3 ubiquitin-protein like [Actinidia chinensis var. chinensis]|uniref:E3 ubiquitin-protein like n=1 Tax=Actinidia chinensis var. chinensis TaxID=1590841 RepID=A0A2R6QAC6_ACTCC|nr:E3 ubiquitin-protein like [Actinidia chinensis var. chinensis]
MGGETRDRVAVNPVDSVNRGICENSSNSVNQNVSETVIVIRSEEEAAVCVSGENENSNPNATVGEGKIKDMKEDKQSCVIDVKSGEGKLGENLDGERVCRICHLSSDPSFETPIPSPPATTTVTVAASGLIQLGCGCKDELGIVHTHCAEAWFKLKGNRQCEICGETAKNVTGVGDNRFIEEWNETISVGSGTNFSERGRGCWRGQPFCNFLMACLVIAFVLPWFFRVNMF